ncbi:MAG: aminoacyl-tRNA hydrolase [Victivallales bacterium]|nr:aminoacyl-tRNA hydrolase [Victivallales bacterium]
METTSLADVASENTQLVSRQAELVVGLGNPGAEYADTRHNAGFLTLDCLLQEALNVTPDAWQPAQGLLLRARLTADVEAYCLKPLTFMNSSGLAVAEVIRHLGISPSRMLVICDDLDLPLGRLRLRSRGSSGGHRGVASIAESLGTEDFPRLRLGIGRPRSGEENVIDYVLSTWASDQSEEMVAAVLSKAAEIVKQSVCQGIEPCGVTVDFGSDKDHAKV